MLDARVQIFFGFPLLDFNSPLGEDQNRNLTL
jgi:hypothetical protein